MPASILCAKALVTTGEWADTLRKVYGEYRPPTGVEGQKLYIKEDRVKALRKKIEEFKEKYGYRPKFLVGKPGLDGHSNGAEMIAVAGKFVGFHVIYSGIRLSPQEIAQSAVEENVDIIGISLLSGAHIEITQELLKELKHYHAEKIPLVIGGIIPQKDFPILKKLGVKEIFTPKDYDLIEIMEKIFSLIEKERSDLYTSLPA